MNTLAELRQAGKGTLHAAYNGVCIELNAEDGRCSVEVYPKISNHNFGHKRFDFWFAIDDGFVWHGFAIGKYGNAHVRRTKRFAQSYHKRLR